MACILPHNLLPGGIGFAISLGPVVNLGRSEGAAVPGDDDIVARDDGSIGGQKIEIVGDIHLSDGGLSLARGVRRRRNQRARAAGKHLPGNFKFIWRGVVGIDTPPINLQVHLPDLFPLVTQRRHLDRDHPVDQFSFSRGGDQNPYALTYRLTGGLNPELATSRGVVRCSRRYHAIQSLFGKLKGQRLALSQYPLGISIGIEIQRDCGQ